MAELNSFLHWSFSPEACGYYASGLVLATFCMRRMVPLRIIALCSNLAFFTYGIALDLLPIALLHAMLFPINIMRLAQQYWHLPQANQHPIIQPATSLFLPTLIRVGLFSCLFLGVTCRPLTGSDITCTPADLYGVDNWTCQSIARDALLFHRRFGIRNQINPRPSPSHEPHRHHKIARSYGAAVTSKTSFKD